MGRIRYIKPDFFKDDDLGEMHFETRLLFAGLWTIADKAGRLEDRPKRIKVELFPYDDIDIEENLRTLAKNKASSGSPFINRYENCGQFYIQIVNWNKHQKPHHTEKESVIPGFFEKAKNDTKRKGNGEGDGKGNGKVKAARSECEVNEQLSNGYLTVKTNRFEKPSPSDVELYAKSIDFIIDGSSFCDFYESKGWLIGKTPMRCWKSAVRTWKKNDNTFTKQTERNSNGRETIFTGGGTSQKFTDQKSDRTDLEFND